MINTNYHIDIAKTLIKLILARGVRKSYSQHGEDIIIQSFLGKRPHGVYVDVGAFHPIQYSNTYALYRRGWKGIAIDPNPRTRLLFKIFRPRDNFVQRGVSSQQETRTYREYSDPAYNTASDEQAREWEQQNITLLRSKPLDLCPLSEIVAQYGVTSIDFLSVDVEGLDLEVLSSHDWTIKPRVVVVESHQFDPSNPSQDDIYTFMVQRGYVLTGMAKYSLIFVPRT